ncbi:MAG TPA: response regulator [Chitinophagaceae bacterium]|nr:response regulator [Chitinophagaceae bacterium]
MKDQKTLAIFILTDDAWHGSMLEQHASVNPDYAVTRFENSETFFQHLHQEQPDVVAIDLPLSSVESSDMVRRIKSAYPRVQIIVLANREDAAAGMQLLKQGVFECIVKDEHIQERLWNTLLHVQELISLRHEVSQIKEKPAVSEMYAGASGVLANGLSHLLGKEISLREYECQIIQYYLEKYNKDVLLVAKKLDIGKSTIYRMIQNGELVKNGTA